MAVMHSKRSELLALFLIAQGGKESYKLLGRLEPAHFMFTATKNAFKRYVKMMSTKSVHLDWMAICEDPTLSDEHRQFLQAFDTDARFIKKASVDNLIGTLEKYRVGRSLVDLVNFTSKKLEEEFDPDTLCDQVADQLLKARTRNEEKKIHHIGVGNNTTDIVKEILDQDAELPIIPTGLKSYDDVFGGLPDCGVVVLAATSSSGKSMMANQLALNMQDTGRDVLKVSLEMPIDQEIIRILANRTGIPVNRIKNKKLTPKEVVKVKKAYKKFVLKSKEIKNRLSIISPQDDMSMRQVLMQAKPYNYDVIIIDYISLLEEEPGVEMWKHLSNIARQAKQFTMSNKCMIVLLAQLDEDSNKVRYSRAIKEHCDVMWTWHVTDADRENNKFTVNQTKGRNDGLLSFEVDVIFDQMRIHSDSSGASSDGNDEERTSDISDLMG